MKKIIQKASVVTLIYLVAIICTFMMTNRLERLEGTKEKIPEISHSRKA